MAIGCRQCTMHAMGCRFFRTTLCLLVLVAARLGDTPAAGAAVDWPQIALVSVVTGINQPTHIANAGDGTGRLFLVEQPGIIRLLKSGVLSDFLDIHAKVSCCGERGLLSVVFPPGYRDMAQDRKHFYVYYTNTAGNIVVGRYGLTANADVGDPDSETIILTVNHPGFANHNGGQLVFGPADGDLYIGTGDGGGGGDPSNNAQNTNVLLGKLLRIDVESGATPYAIPAANPYVNTAGYRGEIWAYGLRNPWRFSFDRATNDLYIGDVGQDTYEEVDFQPAADAGGEDYGWNIMEGFHCYGALTCNMTGLTLPIIEYEHSPNNCSITGGFVYRGTQFARMQGVYFYADYCSGRIWGAEHVGTWQTVQLDDQSFRISSFGEDEAGELYLTDYSNGVIYRIVDTGGPPTPTVPPTPTLTPVPVQVDLSHAVGLAGGQACLPAMLQSNGHVVASTSTDVGFDPNSLSLASCAINPSIGAGTAADKQLSLSVLQSGLDRISVANAANTNALPDGPLYVCTVNIAPGTASGSFTISNNSHASDRTGSALPVSGAVGTVQVTTCNGDCDGNGMVSIGEVNRAVSLFLGQPLCNLRNPMLSCPAADTDHNGQLSIGEVIQSVNHFAGACPP